MMSKELKPNQALASPPAVNQFHLYESMIGTADDAVMISQRPRCSNLLPSILFVNQTFVQITGFDRDEIIGAPATFVQDATRGMSGLGEVETVSFVSEIFHRSGDVIPVTFTVCKLINADVETWIAVFHETSIRHREPRN